LIITIDGPAGSGKSTAARGVARHLDGQYLDTGAMYRAVTLGVLRSRPGSTDPTDAASVAADSVIELGHSDDGSQWIKLNGEDVSLAIREPRVNDNVSWVSAVPDVRAAMVSIQQEIGSQVSETSGFLVAEGRDMGTVVFTDAELKIYLTADVAVRAARRGQDLEAQGHEVSQSEVAESLVKRDRLDSDREIDPLRPADDAVLVDTSNLTADQVISKIAELACGR